LDLKKHQKAKVQQLKDRCLLETLLSLKAEIRTVLSDKNPLNKGIFTSPYKINTDKVTSPFFRLDTTGSAVNTLRMKVPTIII